MATLHNLFDDENRDVLARMEAESEALLKRMGEGNLGKSGLESIRFWQKPEQLSENRNIAYRQIRGGNDDPPKPCEKLPYKNDFYENGINLSLLIQYIKSGYTGVFNYKDFIGKSIFNVVPDAPSELKQTGKDRINIPFEYPDANGNYQKAKLTGRLNKRVCYLEQNPPNLYSGWRLELDPATKTIKGVIDFLYKGALQFRQNVTSTPLKTEFSIANEYKAIIIEAWNIDDFIALAIELYGPSTSREIKADISKQYVQQLKLCSDAKELKFLYNNIPGFVVEDIKIYADLPFSLLWQHVITLTEYDDTGLFSAFKDASSALVNVFRAIGSSKQLYSKFVKDPVLIKRIFHNLDGTSEINGTVASNKIIFSWLVAAVCADNGYKGLNIINKEFKYSKNYRVDSNITQSGEKDDEFFLQQIKVVLVAPPGGMDFLPESLWVEETEPVDSGAIYHPLDIVILVYNPGEKTELKLAVPAIVIKALAQEAEVQDVQQQLRLGFDMLMIVIGLATAATTKSPVILLLALADIGLGTTDAFVQTFRKEIEDLGGKDFLETWEKIYVAGTFITAAPAAISFLSKLGTGLLKAAIAAGNFDVRNFVMACFTKIIIEKNIFAQSIKSLESISDVAKEFGISDFAARLTQLQKEGVAIFKATVEGEYLNQFFLFFNNKVLSAGDINKLIADVSEIARTKGAILLEKIAAFLLLARKEKTLVNTSAKIGESATEETLKWGTVKMKLHPRFEELNEFLRERSIVIEEIENVAEGVGYTERFIFDKGGKTLLRIEKVLEWHPEMRFLDLEHEIDHIIQFEKDLKGKFCTDIKVELPSGKITNFNAPPASTGYTSLLQKSLLEYDVRIKEIIRLKNIKVSKTLLDEHFNGLQKVINEYKDLLPRNSFERIKFEKWKKEYFPEFKELKVSDIN